MEETPSQPLLVDTLPSPAPGRVGVILIISKDAAGAAPWVATLESSGHRVLPAGDVAAALDEVARSPASRASATRGAVAPPHAEPAPVTAVILALPTGDARELELLDRLEREPATAGAAKILLAAGASTEVRVEALRRGADDILSAGVDGAELLARLERRLAGAREPRRVAAAPLLRHALTMGALPSPITVARYSADEVIGQGSMGVVLRGEDPRLQRPVAIKVLGRSHIDAARWADVSAMEHEGAALAHFDHPHIVKVFDAGLTDRMPFLVMELVQGESLASRLERGPVEARAAVGIAEAVALALAEAHGRGWVHRDIKPANILLGDDGSVKVTDFGLAGMIRDARRRNSVFGTPGYAPPECLLGEPHTAAGDLFALGAVLYYSLAGSSAFVGDSIAERLATTLAGRHRPLEEAAPGLPRALYRLVESLLDPLPSARPATAKLVARRLEWLGEAMAYQPVPQEDLEPAETVPIGTAEIVN